MRQGLERWLQPFSLRDTLNARTAIRAFRELQAQGAIRAFALGGASALAFYTEPVLTYDLGFFLILNASRDQVLSLQPIAEYFTKHAYPVALLRRAEPDEPHQV
ncbi:MAG: hypothetical protein P3X24_005840 [bacterium]|nr:hypothetical protein [bacterium]